MKYILLDEQLQPIDDNEPIEAEDWEDVARQLAELLNMNIEVVEDN